MADTLAPLIFTALARAAAEPAGMPVVALKGPGLFPNTTKAKTAAKRCLDEGLLRTVTTPATAGAEHCAITDKGLQYLLESQNPKGVLEDLVRVIEERRGQVNELLNTAKLMAGNLVGLERVLDGLLPKVVSKRIPADCVSEIISVLNDRTASVGEDCPLPDLYSRLPSKPTLGAFHDALRQLHAQRKLHLHPWTGPLYMLPEPSYALLCGHEIAYYASVSHSRVEVLS